MLTGKITSVQISPDGKQWTTPPPPPEIARFAYFYVYPYADISVEGRADLKCVLTLIDPNGAENPIEPIPGTVETGTYYFPFSLQTMDDAPLGVWKGKIQLYGAPESGELALLDTWEGELFSLVAAGNPAAEVVRAEFSTDQVNWLAVPVAVQPGSPLAFRVGFKLWLPLKAKVSADLSLLDPSGKEVKKDLAESEFPPGYSEAWATFTIDKMPEDAGDWIGQAVIHTIFQGQDTELVRWSGYVARIAAGAGPSLGSILGPVVGVAMLGMMIPMVLREVKK